MTTGTRFGFLDRVTEYVFGEFANNSGKASERDTGVPSPHDDLRMLQLRTQQFLLALYNAGSSRVNFSEAVEAVGLAMRQYSAVRLTLKFKPHITATVIVNPWSVVEVKLAVALQCTSLHDAGCTFKYKSAIFNEMNDHDPVAKAAMYVIRNVTVLATILEAFSLRGDSLQYIKGGSVRDFFVLLACAARYKPWAYMPAIVDDTESNPIVKPDTRRGFALGCGKAFVLCTESMNKVTVATVTEQVLNVALDARGTKDTLTALADTVFGVLSVATDMFIPDQRAPMYRNMFFDRPVLESDHSGNVKE